MQDYNTIIGVIQLRQNGCPYSVIRSRYRLGNSTVTLILNRYQVFQRSLEELKRMDPREVEELFFPQANLIKCYRSVSVADR